MEKIYKVLISKKKNSGPNTEFKIETTHVISEQHIHQIPYKKLEYDVIKDIEEGKEYFTKNKDYNDYTKVEVGHREKEKYLKSFNNHTKR